MSSMEPCPFCQQPLTVLGGHNNPYAKCETEGCWLADRAIAVVMDEPRQVAAWNTRAPLPVTDEMVERAAVARCIELIREVQEGFLSPEYATGQPFNSFQERFACGRVIERLEQEYALGTTEQRALLGKPSITAALGDG